MSDITLVILSSDPYQPILKVWEKYFNKHWPQCPYKVLSPCNHKHFESDTINFVVTGIDAREDATHFKPMLLQVLDKVDTEYILYMVEDQILVNDVIEENFIHTIDYMRRFDISKVRCLSMPGPDKSLEVQSSFMCNRDFGIISKDNMYRNSLQAAIWRKRDFVELLNSRQNDFSGWELETSDDFRDYSKKWNYIACKQGKGGTLISREEGQGDSPLLQYVELVRWGKFDRHYIDYFREIFDKDNFSVDTPEYEKFGAGLSADELPA